MSNHFASLRHHLFLNGTPVLRSLLLLSTIAFAAKHGNADDRTPDATDVPLVKQATEAMVKTADSFVKQASAHGGFVYQVSLDGTTRWGEGKATPTEIWVQPPGTPAVGLALLRAYQATGNKQLLESATAAATALIHGQLESGAWTDRVDFDPRRKSVGPYRNGNGNKKGRNYSTLDDDKSQSAIRFLIEMDKAYSFKHAPIHDCVQFALASLLSAQFANGGFPQGWQKPVEAFPVMKASFPDYDWRTEGRVKEYWDYPTLNDGLAGTVTSTLWLAYETYQDERYKNALLKFGDFLILAQLPEPQPAWAQQYSHALVPIWARKFEPAAIVGRESEDVLQTLMFITEKTGERRFLQPIPAAIAWVKRSRLPDGQLARFYELKTNTPLYMVVMDEIYTLTYDDSNTPSHYGFKTESKIDKIEERYQTIAKGETPRLSVSNLKTLRKDVARILAELDAEGRWVTDKSGKWVADTSAKNASQLYFDSALFSKNLSRLAEYVKAAK